MASHLLMHPYTRRLARALTHGATAYATCTPHARSVRRVRIMTALALLVSCNAMNRAHAQQRGNPAVTHQQSVGYEPGKRVLLDAHNSYPEQGKWADRIDRALSNGVPLAIEQDLYWRRIASGEFAPVVAHDSAATDGAPTMEAYFFDKIRPIMERALKENRRTTWPLIVLNLDFKTDEREHHVAILKLLTKYDAWLTTAARTATPNVPAPFAIGPLLVLCGQNETQRRDFADSVKVGDKLRVFGAIPVPAAPGSTREERARNLVMMTAGQLIAPRVSNYARWVNFPWGVVEEGGQRKAADFTPADSGRLVSLVSRAHANGLWIRFYTVDGFSPEEDRGYTADYNFGSQTRAAVRWDAVINAGVDFVATDQYEQFGALLKRIR